MPKNTKQPDTQTPKKYSSEVANSSELKKLHGVSGSREQAVSKKMSQVNSTNGSKLIASMEQYLDLFQSGRRGLKSQTESLCKEIDQSAILTDSYRQFLTTMQRFENKVDANQSMKKNLALATKEEFLSAVTHHIMKYLKVHRFEIKRQTVKAYKEIINNIHEQYNQQCLAALEDANNSGLRLGV